MKKKAVIFDIDGTSANGEHREHYLQHSPKDWKGFFSEMKKDKLNESVACIYRKFLFDRDYEISF